MNREYRHNVIDSLREQLARFAPRLKRVEQIEAAERLIPEIDPARSYPYEWVGFRVTGFRPNNDAETLIPGADLLHDLRLLVEDLSDSVDLPADALGEQVLTVEQLAQQFNVSTKTISRWRELGLVSRRLVFDGRKRVGFLRSSVDRFVRNNQDRVERGARFSQLSDAQRQELLEDARRLAANGACQAEVTRRLAVQTGRSVETIRQAIRQFDTEHPELAIFPDLTGPLSEAQKQRIFKEFGEGVSVDRLVKRYGRTRTTIYRVVNEARAREILSVPLDFIPNARFTRKGADSACLGEMPPGEDAPRKVRRPADLPPYLASLYETALLTREQEQHIFRKYNYLKFKAAKLRDQLDPERPKAPLMDEIESLIQQAVETKNQIAKANLRLVVSIAKKHVTPDQGFFELVSDGNISLLRAVEKFDFSRGNKFSTYATWAIMKNFARSIPTEYKRRDRFRTSHDELFAATEEQRDDPRIHENAQRERERQVRRMLHRLDEREQQIVISRFGLDYSEEPLTLKEVGAKLGVTKERIRQIEARALEKLRDAAREDRVALED